MSGAEPVAGGSTGPADHRVVERGMSTAGQRRSPRSESRRSFTGAPQPAGVQTHSGVQRFRLCRNRCPWSRVAATRVSSTHRCRNIAIDPRVRNERESKVFVKPFAKNVCGNEYALSRTGRGASIDALCARRRTGIPAPRCRGSTRADECLEKPAVSDFPASAHSEVSKFPAPRKIHEQVTCAEGSHAQ